MKIINETSLSYEAIGSIIDQIQDAYKGSTMYVGKTDDYLVCYEGKKKIRVATRVLKSYTEWCFYEE